MEQQLRGPVLEIQDVVEFVLQGTGRQREKDVIEREREERGLMKAQVGPVDALQINYLFFYKQTINCLFPPPPLPRFVMWVLWKWEYAGSEVSAELSPPRGRGATCGGMDGKEVVDIIWHWPNTLLG